MKRWTSSLGCGIGALLAFAWLCAGPGPARGADPAAGVQALQGTWSGMRFSAGTGDDLSAGVALQLTFEGAHVKAVRLPRGAIGEGDIQIGADGRSIDAVGTSAGYRAKRYPGILKIEGDTLYWCSASDGTGSGRPTEFAANAARGNYLIVVKRAAR